MPTSKNIESPQKLWQLFEEYKMKTKSNPILVHDFKGKDADSVMIKKERPLTIEGFENYVADLGIIKHLGDYFANKNKMYDEYSAICLRIRNNIRQDQIEGGMSGIYNPSITQRLNSLVEKTDITTKGESVNVSPIDPTKLSTETLKELINASTKKPE